MFIRSKLTVCFEDPFWIGVFEHMEGDTLSVSKVTFGPEPKDYEVYDFINRHFYELRFSQPVNAEEEMHKRINPKRMQRQIKKATQNTGIGTKAQQAIKREQEARKTERKKRSKENREKTKREKYLKKVAKKKEKKKGH